MGPWVSRSTRHNRESQEGLVGSPVGWGMTGFRELSGKKEGKECP